MLVEKVWGTEEWIENNEKYCLKIMRMKAGFQSSLHYHLQKDETFLIVEGCCDLEFNRDVKRMVVGEKFRIVPGTVHRFRAVDGNCKAIEVATHHSEEDVYRLEESRKIE